jgi:hypothetical protein
MATHVRPGWRCHANQTDALERRSKVRAQFAATSPEDRAFGLSVVAAEVCSPFAFANYPGSITRWARERSKLGARPIRLHARAIAGTTTIDTWSSSSAYAVITRRDQRGSDGSQRRRRRDRIRFHTVIIVVCSRFISGNCTASYTRCISKRLTRSRRRRAR